jgi:hypothetical protein
VRRVRRVRLLIHMNSGDRRDKPDDDDGGRCFRTQQYDYDDYDKRQRKVKRPLIHHCYMNR